MNHKTIAVVAAFACAVICGTALNFLAKRAALSEPPISLNGWRTLVAALILLAPMIYLRVPFKPSPRELAWYAVVAALTMAVPQALIFVGLRSYSVAETTVALVEAAVLGIVIVYLFTSGTRIGVGTIACVALTLIGLAVFLGAGPDLRTVGVADFLILIAAVATGLGFIAAEKIEPPAETTSLLSKCQRSLKKTFYACLFAGGGTILTIALLQLSASDTSHPVPVPAMASWPWIILLALVGSCLTWFSVFLLIALGQLVLAAAVIAAVPVTTEVANYLWFAPTVTSLTQWTGGTTVLAALAALIWLQLIRADQSSRPVTITAESAS